MLLFITANEEISDKPWWLELVSKLLGGVVFEVEVWEVVVVWEERSLGFLMPEVEPDEPATVAVVAMSWRSRRRAAGTHVLFTCVAQSKPRLLQHVLHRLWVQSFFAWFPQSWHVVPELEPEPPPMLVLLLLLPPAETLPLCIKFSEEELLWWSRTVAEAFLRYWFEFWFCQNWIWLTLLRPLFNKSWSSIFCWEDKHGAAVRRGITPTPTPTPRAVAAFEAFIGSEAIFIESWCWWWWWWWWLKEEAGATTKTSRRPTMPISEGRP